MGNCGASSSKSSKQTKQPVLLNKYAAAADELRKKMPMNPKPLHDLMTEAVFVKSFSKVNKDILRLIRRVSIHRPSHTEGIIKLDDLSLPPPLDDHQGKQGVYLVLVLMKHLLGFFEGQEAAQPLCANLDQCFEIWSQDPKEAQFDVLQLINSIGGEKTKTALAVRCIDQSIAINGHMHIKSKVAPDFTKDVPGKDGWQVQFTLSDYVQVRHTRREQSMMQTPDQAWSIEYAVHLTFDKEMKEITATKLTILELTLGADIDPELKEYLEERFNGGDLVVA